MTDNLIVPVGVKLFGMDSWQWMISLTLLHAAVDVKIDNKLLGLHRLE